ncbi:hypothetical protein SASPL_146519 [Salvia splendens]|uniref:Uncharacterized protein n=1 Tax=Salvia splendens TaxID=180675 RepID=A0A8X8WDS3_SALSN|nr:hypothetical protein SASPL_146519 [Salvia splendens]
MLIHEWRKQVISARQTSREFLQNKKKIRFRHVKSKYIICSTLSRWGGYEDHRAGGFISRNYSVNSFSQQLLAKQTMTEEEKKCSIFDSMLQIAQFLVLTIFAFCSPLDAGVTESLFARNLVDPGPPLDNPIPKSSFDPELEFHI